MRRRMRTDSGNKSHTFRGQSLVEFALLLPLLMLILLGILDLGRITASYVILENAAREGARYGASNPGDSSGIIARAHSEASGTIINTTQMNVSPSCLPCTSGNALTVQVTYPFTFITTYLFAGLNSISISTQAVFEITSD